MLAYLVKVHLSDLDTDIQEAHGKTRNFYMIYYFV